MMSKAASFTVELPLEKAWVESGGNLRGLKNTSAAITGTFRDRCLPRQHTRCRRAQSTEY